MHRDTAQIQTYAAALRIMAKPYAAIPRRVCQRTYLDVWHIFGRQTLRYSQSNKKIWIFTNQIFIFQPMRQAAALRFLEITAANYNHKRGSLGGSYSTSSQLNKVAFPSLSLSIETYAAALRFSKLYIAIGSPAVPILTAVVRAERVYVQ